MTDTTLLVVCNQPVFNLHRLRILLVILRMKCLWQQITLTVTMFACQSQKDIPDTKSCRPLVIYAVYMVFDNYWDPRLLP